MKTTIIIMNHYVYIKYKYKANQETVDGEDNLNQKLDGSEEELFLENQKYLLGHQQENFILGVLVVLVGGLINISDILETILLLNHLTSDLNCPRSPLVLGSFRSVGALGRQISP